MNSHVKAEIRDVNTLWQDRIRRLQQMRGHNLADQASLQFYEAVLDFQAEVAIAAADIRFVAEVSLRQKINPTMSCAFMPQLLALTKEHGPQKLQAAAAEILREGEGRWKEMAEAVLWPEEPDFTTPESFFSRAWIQPLAERLQAQVGAEKNSAQPRCPACGCLPQFSVLRPEGEGASRYLVCCFCLREWLFRRVICPWCGEEDKEKLPRYSTEECSHVYLQACDTCTRYLKAIDLSVDGHAVPLIDEAATPVLEVWAATNGYTKIVPNLLGF